MAFCSPASAFRLRALPGPDLLAFFPATPELILTLPQCQMFIRIFLARETIPARASIDVDAFESALAGRVPENILLSHDLFESLFARAALVTDIELLDDYPSHYDAYAKRQHRWTRGDWQILRWLFPVVQTQTGAECGTRCL